MSSEASLFSARLILLTFGQVQSFYLVNIVSYICFFTIVIEFLAFLIDSLRYFGIKYWSYAIYIVICGIWLATASEVNTIFYFANC